MQRSDWDPDWERIKKICASALELPASERGDFIAKACEHDPFLISEVESRVAAANADKLVGTLIDHRYYVERALDQGGMGKVYLALDRRLDNRAVVIKILLEASLRNPEVVQRFREEAVALSRIAHAGVVGILDAGELSGGEPYLVMQYVEGESLRRHIHRERMDLDRAARILKEIGDALSYVHEKGIFHRDLKPENIMIESATGAVKIVDFGIAKVTDSAVAATTGKRALIGTLLYMSPERLRREPSTAADDIYSMAVIAYEMLTGQWPFYSKSAPELLQMQEAGVSVRPRELRQDLSPEAERVLLEALSFNPERRHKTAKGLGDTLARALLQTIPRTGFGKTIASRVVLILAISLLSVGTYFCIRGRIEKVVRGHTLNYWLNVQEMRGGENYKSQFRSFGGETFESGDRFQLNVASGEPGYLYLLNEGPPQADEGSFRFIYPKQSTNNASATVGSNQPVQSEWITFRGPAGTENFWIVWSPSPVAELEVAKTEDLTDQNLARVKDFLKRKQAETKVRITRYQTSQTAFVRGKAELLVALVEFKHR
jgi:serine/threonine protein kinase